jgi:putative ABC transport system ATP-binding protein
MSATLVVEGLNKTYGSGGLAVRAVRDVSFSTQPGDFIAIAGPSGSGKTTLLAMIGGLLTPSSGSIRVGDREITRLSAADRAAYRRDSVGFVFQANNLIPFLTARENLMIMNEIGPGSRDKLGLMVTHDLKMAALADVILEMRDGHLKRKARQRGAHADR